ncbi:MAG: DNA-3-methyladenine glycosylase 2 family protein [Acidobacteriota bacterium]
MARALTKNSLRAAAELLASKDRDLAFVLQKYGPPPMWSRDPGFSTLIHIILEQQVSLASAAAMFARLTQNIVPLSPERFIDLGAPHLKSLGMTRQKTAYCLHLAETVRDKQLDLAGFGRLSDDDVKAALMRLKGIGSWSAEVYLLMVLRRPDIWPASDLALATAAFKLKRLRERPTPERLMRLGNKWRPFRSVAARMLWQYYLGERAAKRETPKQLL